MSFVERFVERADQAHGVQETEMYVMNSDERKKNERSGGALRLGEKEQEYDEGRERLRQHKD